MRVAICLYGLVGSRTAKDGVGRPLNPRIAATWNEKNLLKPNQADVFIQTWSDNAISTLEAAYRPIRIAGSDFGESHDDLRTTNVSSRARFREWLLAHGNVAAYKRELASIPRILSRWESTRRSLQLMIDHEQLLGRKYEAVLVTRLDVAFYTPLRIETYDLSKVWVSHWNNYPIDGVRGLDFTNHGKGWGVLDFWFFSNRENVGELMHRLGDINQFHLSPHRSLWEYTINSGLEIGYTKYRWVDHEMVRRKHYGAIQ